MMMDQQLLKLRRQLKSDQRPSYARAGPPHCAQALAHQSTALVSKWITHPQEAWPLSAQLHEQLRSESRRPFRWALLAARIASSLERACERAAFPD
eukprot:1877152-Pleurochrysis_carterae.AAC.9